ncbi:hypothetical protein GCK72_010150 [Caenorhabditis remanei]|uniref:Uncharacterized protein n=1 Tax=Caenorhabditis remanei TaxID=31234 RepID=A0A6A5H4J1_CAERE|nr:hypothetical protein GCK72_010150 [Caenorhabditis remanei]KAF1761891.1 hypothetical protein GCK72_010150 [Caenorhabditis remanei]
MLKSLIISPTLPYVNADDLSVAGGIPEISKASPNDGGGADLLDKTRSNGSIDCRRFKKNLARASFILKNRT